LDNQIAAFALYKLTERNRELSSDHLIKSAAPNAKDLCTGQIDFASTISELQNNSQGAGLDTAKISSIIHENTDTVHVSKSTREASIDLSQAYLMNLAMVRLLNHHYKQERSVLDNYRPT
jgi:hypothetical protein